MYWALGPNGWNGMQLHFLDLFTLHPDGTTVGINRDHGARKLSRLFRAPVIANYRNGRAWL